MTSMVLLRRGDPAYDDLMNALREAGLPTEDVDDGVRLYAVIADERVIGFGGLEGGGPDQLIRSVVVSARAPGLGHGRRIAEEFAEQARTDGAERLWLLTTSADHFFAALGWVVVDRADAPERVRASRQFSGVCPASAILMHRALQGMAHV